MSADSQIPGAVTAAEEKKKKGTSFTLAADVRGAQINGALFTLYAGVSLVIAVRADPNSPWFYLFYFLACLAVFQGGTIVLRHCLHLLPGSVVSIDLVGKNLRLTRKNGKQVEISHDIDYTRRKNVLVVEGQTHDKVKVSEVIREGTLGSDDFEALVNALKRFR